MYVCWRIRKHLRLHWLLCAAINPFGFVIIYPVTFNYPHKFQNQIQKITPAKPIIYCKTYLHLHIY